MIYFVRSHKTGHIKIGFTRNMSERFRTLQIKYGKIDILGVMDGDCIDERRLHMQFASLWIDEPDSGREWFRAASTLMRHIEFSTVGFDPQPLPKIPVTIDIAMHQQLRVLAAQRGISTAELVRQALRKQLEQEGIEIDMSEGMNTWGGAGRKGDTRDSHL